MTAHAAPAGRLPALLFGIVALFTAVHFAQGLLFPQQAYPEWAPRQFLLMVAIGMVAWGATWAARFADDARLRGARWAFGVAAGALLLFAATALPRSLAIETPLEVTWPATVVQMIAAFVVGFALVAHHRGFGVGAIAGGAPTGRPCELLDERLARFVGAVALGVTLLLVADALHQHAVRLPRHYAELASGGPAALREAGIASARADAAAGDPSGLHARMLHALATGRVSSRFGNPNLLAAALVLLWPLVVLAATTARGRAWRTAAWGAALLAVPAVLALTGSRGGVLTFACVAAMTGVWLLGMPRGRGGWRAMAVGIAMIILGTGLGAALRATAPIARLHAATLAAARPPDAETAPQLAARGSTIRQRVGFLRVALALVPEAGARGLGAGGFALHFLRVQPPRQQESQYVHDWPLQVLVEQGWFGLAALLVAIVAVAVGCGSALRRRGTPAPLAVAALIAFAAFHLSGLVEITTYHTELAMLGWLLGGVALAAAVDRAPSGDGAAASSRATPSSPARRWGRLVCRQVLPLPFVVLVAVGLQVFVFVPLEAKRRTVLATHRLDEAAALLASAPSPGRLAAADRAAIEEALLAASHRLAVSTPPIRATLWALFHPSVRGGAAQDREVLRLAMLWRNAQASMQHPGAPMPGAPTPGAPMPDTEPPRASAALVADAEQSLLIAWWTAHSLGRRSSYRLPSIHLDAAEFLLGPVEEEAFATWLRHATRRRTPGAAAATIDRPFDARASVGALIDGALARAPNHPPTLRRAAALLRHLGESNRAAVLDRHADACDLDVPPPPPDAAP